MSDASAPPPFGDFERVVAALARQVDDKLVPTQLQRNAASFSLRRARGDVNLVVLRHDVIVGEAGEKRLIGYMKTARLRALDVIVVGGDERTSEMLDRVRPRLSGRGVGFLHLRDDGSVFEKRSKAAMPLLMPFDEKLPSGEIDEAAWSHILARHKDVLHGVSVERREYMDFMTTVKRRVPLATYGFIALIAVMFALEILLGGPELAPVLVRLGALVPQRVAHGEWWRLLACTFLHGGWMHVAFNVFVLYALGSFLERIVGSARFIVVYAAAALCGSAASTLLTDASMSVGASGAVWGLLGAHAVLAYRSRGLLPQAMIAGAKKAALINLGLNVANSFRPRVDMWAHFGGGAAGALLILTGVLTFGLPRLGELELRAASGEADAGAAVPTSLGWRVVAALCVVVLVSGPVLAVALSEPFELKTPPALRDTDIPELALRLPLPESTARVPVTKMAADGPATLVFGDFAKDPLTLALTVSTFDERVDARAMRDAISKKSAGESADPPVDFDVNGAPALCQSDPNLRRPAHDVCFLVWPGRILRVETMRWRDFPTAAPDNLIRQILDGTRPL